MARTTSAMMMSLGTVNMWGFSPAFDLQRGLDARPKGGANGGGGPVEPLCVLLIGPGDIRHVLHTIAHRRRHTQSPDEGLRPIHFYVYERSVECLARHLLLLHIAQDWELPLRQRCNTFLEVFGNTLVQERTSAYIEEMAQRLIDFVHHDRGWLADQVDLSHLKMRTRDELVDTIQSWRRNVGFDVAKLRDHRLRHYYEVRYDYRNNLIDWDYTMNLKKIENASVIHIKQYREWRNSGIAFEFGDQTYTVPNRSMAAYTEARQKHHGSVLCRGLWTDIVIGPFISFGVQCDQPNKYAEQLFEIHNKGSGVEQNRHNTVEVAVYNILSYLHEIETGDVYRMKKAHDVYSGIGNENAKVNEHSRIVEAIDESNQDDESPSAEILLEAATSQQQEAKRRAKTILDSLDGVKVIPLTGKVEDLYAKQRYQGLFDRVYVSSQHCHILQQQHHHREDAAKGERSLTSLLRDQSVVSVESSVFLLPLSEDQRVRYVTTLVEMAAALGLQAPFPFAAGVSKGDLAKPEHAVLDFGFHRARPT